jgi:hypothetical protein
MRERRSNHRDGSFLEYSTELFAGDGVVVGGVKIVEVQDGTNRYASTWTDETGRPRMSVCGFFGVPGIVYRNLKKESKSS